MKKIGFPVLFLLLICFVFSVSQPAAAAEDQFRITVIDVGKGDCILVQAGGEADGVNVLIDAGYKDTAKEVLAYLKAHNVKKLDAIIISHFHKDHVGGGAAILKNKDIPVGKVYMPDYEGTRKVYLEMMTVLEESGGKIPYERLKNGAVQTVALGDAVFTLYPSTIDFDGDNDNNVSMAASLEYKGHSAFFAGDLEEDGIKQLLDKNKIPANHYDILKLPHHGALETNTDDLLALLKQDGIVMITDGHAKRAHGTLIDILKKDGFEYYCSAEDGTVIITAVDGEYEVHDEVEPDYRTDGDWKYLVMEDGTAEIAHYTGNGAVVTVPDTIGGMPVSAIGDSAFYNNKTLTHVIISDGIRTIGASAFSWCQKLTQVDIPGSVATIKDGAFSWCTALEEIVIPDTVRSIGESGFESCANLKRVTLSRGLTSLAPSLFERCESLVSIVIPEGVTAIEKDAFKRCEKLASVSIPKSVTLIDEGAFKRCSSLESIDIPEGVKTIDESAFENCVSLRNIVLPKSLTSLGKSAFRFCYRLEKITIPEGIGTIKKTTFGDCTGLKTVILSGNVTSIKEEAFVNCSVLKDIWFDGTAEQWDQVSRDKNWNKGTPEDLKIHFGTPDDDPEPGPDDDRFPSKPFFTLRELPKTGFSAFRPEALRDRPAEVRYDRSGMLLQIPSLDVAEEIVSIPFANGEYPVEWLSNDIGLPAGFSEPGAGPSVLVGHNHLNTTEAGPFALLAVLPENSHIFVTDRRGEMTAFSVFVNEKIAGDDLAAVAGLLQRSENPLVLITCEDEQLDGTYAARRVIAAKPAGTGS